MRRAHDDRFCPTHCQPGQRCFIAHVLGQTDRIADGTFVVGVRQITAPTQRWPQATAVNGNHGFKPCNGINTEVQRLHMSALHESKH